MQSSRLPRKLAAVLYADVAGYSRLTAENEDATHRRLGQELDRIAAIVARHRGTVMHYAGDAVLAQFAAVVDALACAVEVQRAVATRNAGLPADRRLEFRIGINLGDVIEDRGDVYGDGVNVAARVQTIAGAGEICVSASVCTAAGKKLPLEFEDLGEQTLKNIDKPVRVYRVLAAGDWDPAADSIESEGPDSRRLVAAVALYGVPALLAVALGIAAVSYLNGDSTAVPGVSAPTAASGAAAPAGGQSSTVTGSPSIAVLPFVNLSADAEQEYFADGLSEEILNSLAAISGLRVVARTSSFAYKGKNEDLRTIGQALGVEHVLEGSVRRDGDDLRIAAQLINASDGYHLWSQTYARARADVFAIQEDIAKEVAERLQIKLGVGRIGSRAGMTRNVEAYDEYLRAHAPVDTLSVDTVRRLERAVEIDPSFAIAWAELAIRYVGYAGYVDIPREEWSAKSAQALARAGALAPEAPAILESRAYVAMNGGQWLEAGRIWAQIEALGDARAANGYAGFLINAGRVAAAIEQWERAKTDDPLNASIPSALARAYTSAGKLREANAAVEHAAGLGVDGTLARLRIALAMRDRNLLERTLVPIFEAEARAADSVGEYPIHAAMGRLLDDAGAARAAIARMVAEPGNRSDYDLTLLAQWAGYYGDPALALEVLNTVRASGSSWVVPFALWSATMGETRALPGFKTLVTELGLVAYWREMGWADFCSPVGDDDFQCR